MVIFTRYIYKTQQQEGNKIVIHTWGASIVQTLLSQYIILWELQNKEVHRKTKEHQGRTQKERLKIEVN